MTKDHVVPTITTEDGVKLCPGQRAFNYYDHQVGVIGADIDAQGWFTFIGDDGSEKSLNGDRVCSLKYAAQRLWVGCERCGKNHQWTSCSGDFAEAPETVSPDVVFGANDPLMDLLTSDLVNELAGPEQPIRQLPADTPVIPWGPPAPSVVSAELPDDVGADEPDVARVADDLTLYLTFPVLCQVVHAVSNNAGRVHGRTMSLGPYDEDGPWLYVEFFDGLTCWCPAAMLRRFGD